MAVRAHVDMLEGAREAASGCRWGDAYEIVSRVDQMVALTAEDLELLSTAAFLTGHGDVSRQASLRAYQIRANSGQKRKAARGAVKLGLDRLDTAEIAHASGCLPASLSSCSTWMAQAAALVKKEEDCVEHGYLLVPSAFEYLVAGNDDERLEESVRLAECAVEIGRRFDDPELTALAEMILGRALIRSRREHQGMSILEDSVTIAVRGEVAAPVAGLVLTAAVKAAEEQWDLRRFDRFVQLLDGWCERQQGMVQFRSRSLGHMATLNRLQGRWATALESARAATDPELGNLDHTAMAEALYEQGEILRLRGQLDVAEDSYRRAAEMGRDPQPGLAALRLSEGDIGTAAAAITRAVAESSDPLQRSRLLATEVEILVEADELDGAERSARELVLIAEPRDIPYLDATAREAEGMVRLAKGEPLSALRHLRETVRVRRHLGLPYEEGRARTLVARSCHLLGDEDSARLEAEAAARIFRELGAQRNLADAQNIIGKRPKETHGLTRRELEVLRLLADGLTNKGIAEELVLAVRTVDSHVSNLYTKLGVANRAGATTYAHQNGLL